MSDLVPIKRRRGGQPGNKNAKHNSGNRNPRRNWGNRGGKGASKGNQFACKPHRSVSVILSEDYKHDFEALQWIAAHSAVLDALNIQDEKRVERAIRDAQLGLTPERLGEKCAELRHGLAQLPDALLDNASPLDTIAVY